MRRLLELPVVSLMFGLVASATPAQRPPTRGTAVIDLTLGSHRVNGGFIDDRNGALFDVLLAGAVRSSSKLAFVVGAGAGAVVGGFGDRCLIKPSGGCAPKGNFVAADALAGIDVPFGKASSRFLVGPAIYDGASATSLGAQVRADLLSPSVALTGLGVMARATWLPSHGGGSLVAWAIGGGLTIR